jgi:hypothetical protein
MKKILLLLALVLTSCIRNSRKGDIPIDNIPTIDFNQKQNIDILDLLEVDFIKLETSENILINKNIRQVESFENKIFILSDGESSSLIVFDRSGKFIISIGNTGVGPKNTLLFPLSALTGIEISYH